MGPAPMRHLRIYRAIRLIQRTGSVRKAAELLAVSPSALNRSVQAFEAELSLPVFERVQGGMRLTSAGELLLDMVNRHLTEFDDLRAQLLSIRDGLSGLLRLAIGSDIAAGQLLGAVREFETAFPGISVEIDIADSITPLRRREVDLAILTNPETDDTVEIVHARTIRLGAWQAAQAGDAMPAGLWDLAGLRLLLPPSGTGSRIAIDHLLRRQRIAQGIVSTLPAAQLDQHLRADGRVAIFPETVFGPDGPPTGCRALPLGLPGLQVNVMRAARVPMIRPAQAFLSLVQRRLEALAQGEPD
jgi:DNA-binding transcriptional LysR family regulator